MHETGREVLWWKDLTGESWIIIRREASSYQPIYIRTSHLVRLFERPGRRWTCTSQRFGFSVSVLSANVDLDSGWVLLQCPDCPKPKQIPSECYLQSGEGSPWKALWATNLFLCSVFCIWTSAERGQAHFCLLSGQSRPGGGGGEAGADVTDKLILPQTLPQVEMQIYVQIWDKRTLFCNNSHPPGGRRCSLPGHRHWSTTRRPFTNNKTPDRTEALNSSGLHIPAVTISSQSFPVF